MLEALDNAGDIENPDREWEYTVDGYIDHAARARRWAEDLLKKDRPNDPGIEDWRFIVRKRPPSPRQYGT